MVRISKEGDMDTATVHRTTPKLSMQLSLAVRFDQVVWNCFIFGRNENKTRLFQLNCSVELYFRIRFFTPRRTASVSMPQDANEDVTLLELGQTHFQRRIGPRPKIFHSNARVSIQPIDGIPRGLSVRFKTSSNGTQKDRFHAAFILSKILR